MKSYRLRILLMLGLLISLLLPIFQLNSYGEEPAVELLISGTDEKPSTKLLGTESSTGSIELWHYRDWTTNCQW